MNFENAALDMLSLSSSPVADRDADRDVLPDVENIDFDAPPLRDIDRSMLRDNDIERSEAVDLRESPPPEDIRPPQAASGHAARHENGGRTLNPPGPKKYTKDQYIDLRDALTLEASLNKIHLVVAPTAASKAWAKFYTATFDHVIGPNGER